MRSVSSVALAVLLTAGLASAACATPPTVYLVGAYLFSATNTGATSSIGYQYDTNNTEAAVALTVNGQGGTPKNISIALTSSAVNNLTFQSLTSASLAGPNAALGLFFSSTPTSYSPSGAGSARTPDLLASVASGGTTFFVPSAGTSINDYAYSASETANGASNFTVSGQTVSFAAFTASNGANNTVNGSFSLNLSPASAAPEPGTLSLVGMGLVSGASAFRIARRRNKPVKSA